MRYLHTMGRIKDVDESLDFYCNKLGLIQTRRNDYEQGRFSLIFLSAAKDEESRRHHQPPAARWPHGIY